MSTSSLWRYTDLPALVYLLSKRQITLLDPQTWDDGNDSHYLSVYRSKKKLESVLALCFTQAHETYHHWRVFSGGPSGVRIEFDRAELLKAVKGPSVRAEEVKYRTLAEIRSRKPKTRDLPFLKRQAFSDDEEFRIVYESKRSRVRVLDIPIPLSCILKITLSPWSHPSISSSVRRVLKSIDGCDRMQILRSTLIGNDEWKTFAESSI